MNPPPEEVLFALALGRPASARASFPDGACRGHAALRRRVEALLAAHDDAASVLHTVNP